MPVIVEGFHSTDSMAAQGSDRKMGVTGEDAPVAMLSSGSCVEALTWWWICCDVAAGLGPVAGGCHETLSHCLCSTQGCSVDSCCNLHVTLST